MKMGGVEGSGITLEAEGKLDLDQAIEKAHRLCQNIVTDPKFARYVACAMEGVDDTELDDLPHVARLIDQINVELKERYKLAFRGFRGSRIEDGLPSGDK